MHSSTSIMKAGILAASAVSASSVIQGRQMTTTTCADVHMFLARGNTEPYPGRQSVLVAEVCDREANCDYEDIVFKDGADDVYCDSIYEGATNGYNQIVAYNARCPDAKLVLSGYSQGAHVVSDILAGGGGNFFGGCVEPETPQLSASSAAGKMVKAITTYGNVRHTADQPYNYGTGSANNSGYPRDADQQALLNTYQNVWRDYCQIGDPVCARGDVKTDHTNYFDIFTYGAADWIAEKLSESDSSSTTSSSTIAVVTPVATVSSSSEAAVQTTEVVQSSATATVIASSSVFATTVASSSDATPSVVSSSAPASSAPASSAPASSAPASSAPASSAPASPIPISSVTSSAISIASSTSSTAASSISSSSVRAYPIAYPTPASSIAFSSAPASSALASSAPVSSAPASFAPASSVASYPTSIISLASSSTLSSSIISSSNVAYPTLAESSAAPSPTVKSCRRKQRRAD